MQHLTNNGQKLLSPLKEAAESQKPTPIKAQEAICITCKMPLKEGQINYVRAGYDWEKMKTIIKPCPACSTETARRETAKRESEVLARIFGGAHIPWRARGWTFANYPDDADQQARACVQDFVFRHLEGDEWSKRFLYLAGATGRCKTSLAISALKEALKVGRSGLYVMTAELMVKLQASFKASSDYNQDELLQAVSSVEWLVLDDLAVESGSDQKTSAYTLKSLYLIIQKRADKGLYTIITSNLTPSDLERYWRPAGLQEGQFHEGSRIIERLREYAEGCAVHGRNSRA
jgi:DNA replication protein DnaC